MKKSKLIALVKTLSPLEIRSFRKLLKSTDAKSGKNQTLFDYCVKHIEKPEKLDKREIYPKIFGKYDYKAKLIVDLMAALSKQLQAFLIQEEIRTDEDSENYLLQKIYEKRGLDKYYFTKLKKTQSKLEKSPYRDSAFYQQQFQLNHTIFFHPNTDKFETGLVSFEDAVRNLDQFYAMTRMQYVIEYRMRSLLLKIEPDETLYRKEITDFFQTMRYLDPSPIQLFLEINTFLDESMTDKEIPLKRILQSIEACGQAEKVIRITFLLNLLSKMMVSGQINGQLQMLEIYRWGIQNKILLQKEETEYAHLVNAILLASENGQTDWASQLLDQFDQLERKEYGHFHICKAYIAFGKQQYHDCISHLVRVPDRNIALNLWRFPLEIRAYYELASQGHSHLLEETLSAFHRFLSVNKEIAAEIRLSNTHFLQIVKDLHHIKELRKRAKQIAAIKQDFESLNPLILRKWLREKIQDFESNSKNSKQPRQLNNRF